MKLFSFSWRSILLKWNLFFMQGGIICYTEYFPVFTKQLGLTPSQIGWTSLYGVPSVAALPIGFLADKMRARKSVFAIITVLLVLLALAPLLPLVAKTLENCNDVQDNYSRNLTATSAQYNSGNISHNNDNSSLRLLLFVVIIRSLFETSSCSAVVLQSTAIMTYRKKNKESFGLYLFWTQVAAAIFLFTVGMIASYVDISMCGTIQHGYYVSFAVAAIAMGLSLVSFPWIQYEYLEHRVITWNEVKAVLVDKHYIVVLLIDFYCGWCFSFQYQWEYWYVDHLSGGPTILALGGLLRRPFVALWFMLSVPIIKGIGDLFTMALALLAYIVSQLALSFIWNPWLVLVVDILQSLGFALSYTAIFIHFSKAGTKASSAVTMAIFGLIWRLGAGFGSTFTGLVFHRFGPSTTLLSYAIFTLVVFILFLGYIYGSKKAGDYELAAQSGDEDDDYKY